MADSDVMLAGDLEEETNGNVNMADVSYSEVDFILFCYRFFIFVLLSFTPNIRYILWTRIIIPNLF